MPKTRTNAGYSTKSLLEKLGIPPDTRIVVLNPPSSYRSLLGDLPPGATIVSTPGDSTRFIHCFAVHAAQLDRQFPSLKDHLASDGILWISWPKKSSGVQTDLTEDRVRATGLRNGLVDVKVCAVDDIWSGLKFVYRWKDR